MSKVTEFIRSSLAKDEQNLSLEQRNKIYAEEMRKYGFLGEARLAYASEVPQHESIELSYNNGTVNIDSLPPGCGELLFVIGRSRFDAFSEDIEGIEAIFADHQIITLERPEEGISYDFGSLAGGKEIPHLKGEGSLYLGNSISGPGHFRAIAGSIVEVVIMQGGYIRIDLANLECASLSFRLSRSYDNAFDVIVDTDIRAGDVYISNVRNGMILYNPALASALRHQAVLERIDVDKGRFCAVCEFCDPVETPIDHFVDANRYNGLSSQSINREMFFVYE